MPSTQTDDGATVARALTNALTAASHAPSIHNTEPWRWRAHGGRLDLFIDESRTLTVAHPDRRLAILSCGAALHHALISLAADGRHTTVTRLPGQGRPAHLAALRVGARIPVEAAAIRRLQTIGLRHTDRRTVGGTAVDADTMRSIVAAAESQQAQLHLLRPMQVVELASTTDHAQHVASDDQAWQAERQDWTGGARPLGAGIPDTGLPRAVPPTKMSPRDFGRPDGMAIADTHDRAAAFAILHGPGDSDLDWLRGGEALSAAWLKATELGVFVLPLSSTIEVTAARETVRNLLPGTGHPYLVLRFGVFDAEIADPPRTPRLPTTVEETPRGSQFS